MRFFSHHLRIVIISLCLWWIAITAIVGGVYVNAYVAAHDSLATYQNNIKILKSYNIPTEEYEKNSNYFDTQIKTFHWINDVKGISTDIQDSQKQSLQFAIQFQQANLIKSSQELKDILDSKVISYDESTKELINNSNSDLTDLTILSQEVKNINETKASLLVTLTKSNLDTLDTAQGRVEDYTKFFTDNGNLDQFQVTLVTVSQKISVSKETNSSDPITVARNIDTDIVKPLQLLEDKKVQITQEKAAQELQRKQEEEQQFAQEQIARNRSSNPKYIYVKISEQTMYAYDNGKMVYSTPVTTGRNDAPTVRGTYAIYAKEKGRYLQGYDPGKDHYYKVWVDYWMPFYQGYGIHDANWRTIFGTSSYTWNGSLGCVNTPTPAVMWMWNWAQVGTPVIVED